MTTWPWGYRFNRNEEGTVDLTPRCVEAVAPYGFLLPPNNQSLVR